MQQKLRHFVFWPPFLLLTAALTYSLIDNESFLTGANMAKKWVLTEWGWLFSWSALFFLITAFVVYISPLGSVRIGGEGAKPILTKWRWFSITLCTTIAIGILFWATTEPLYHLYEPPSVLGLEPNSDAARYFSISTLFMHWTFVPYAMYTLPGLLFAICYYNMNGKFSISATFKPIFKKDIPENVSQIIDSICLYSLIGGMAASLSAGVLTIAGGAVHLLGIPMSNLLLGAVTGVIVITFIYSAATGLLRGIRILSDINTKIFFIMALGAFIFGPTLYILHYGFYGFIDLITNFPERGMVTESMSGSEWSYDWTIFYWANWLAWAPISALFLGKIAYGYTVRQFIVMNLILPAIFGCIWMSVFGGSSLYLDQMLDGLLYQNMKEGGLQSVIFTILSQLPFATFIAVFFVLTAFISYVTASDSNTDAMGGVCIKGVCAKNPDSPLWIKIIWGIIIGMVAWIMGSNDGIDGIRIVSTLGGFPALFLVIIINFILLKVVWDSVKEKVNFGSHDQRTPML